MYSGRRPGLRSSTSTEEEDLDETVIENPATENTGVVETENPEGVGNENAGGIETENTGGVGSENVHLEPDIVFEPLTGNTASAIQSEPSEVETDPNANVPNQLYKRVIDSLSQTQSAMQEIRLCIREATQGVSDTRTGMNEARESYNEAQAGIINLQRLVSQQTDNVTRLLEAMTRNTTSSPSNSSMVNNVPSDSTRSSPSISDQTPLVCSSSPQVSVNSTLSPQVTVNPPSSQVTIKVDREVIPHFSVSAAASVLARNQELESWIRRIELATTVNDDAARIRLARTYCRGTADLVINSPEFEVMSSWSHFKALLRQKFRGTSSSSDFFTNLQRKTMKSDQTPQDFLLEVEGIVYMGMRDHASEIGEPIALIRRIFLAGLPPTIADMLIACEELPLYEVASKANKLFLSRQNRTPASGTRTPVPIAATQTVPVSPDSHTPISATQTSVQREPYCYYHRASGHLTSQCRQKPQGHGCWHCGREDHQRYKCPFLKGQAATPTPSGHNVKGANVDDA